MDEPHCSFSISSLVCTEKEACFDSQEVKDDIFISYFAASECEEEEEYIQMLVGREKNFESYDCSTVMNQDWLKCARLDAIKWILKIKEYFGFQSLTAYLSVTYFDRFLSKRSIDSGKPWAIQLLSVACLSLAAKTEECKIPALSEFQMEDYHFESKVIQRMELLVLNTLDWRLNSITPFDYLHYFITKLSDDETRKMDLVSRAVDFTMTTIKELNLMQYRPSAIAMAAVLAASNERLTRTMVDVKINLASSCGSLLNDHVYSCYSLMVELEMEKIKTPKFFISPDLSSIYSSSADVYEDSSFISGSRTKRRRLTFHDYDHNNEMPNEKRSRAP